MTWEKPEQYVNYLNYMKSVYTVLPEDCWSVGYSDDTQIPYYVNEITRVVSWEKPANFKENPAKETLPAKGTSTDQTRSKGGTDKKARTSRTRSKKTTKKSLPKHLQATGSDDE